MAGRGEGAAPERSGIGGDVHTVPAHRDFILLLTAAAALQAIAWLVIYRGLVAQKWGYVPWLGSDTAYYADVGLRVTGGQWPYTQFPFEYPPLSLLLFILPPLRGTLATYHTWFGAQMIAIDAATAIITTAAAARIWSGLGAVGRGWRPRPRRGRGGSRRRRPLRWGRRIRARAHGPQPRVPSLDSGRPAARPGLRGEAHAHRAASPRPRAGALPAQHRLGDDGCPRGRGTPVRSLRGA